MVMMAKGNVWLAEAGTTAKFEVEVPVLDVFDEAAAKRRAFAALCQWANAQVNEHVHIVGVKVVRIMRPRG